MDKESAIKMREAILDIAMSLDKYINMIEREEAGEEINDSEAKQFIGEIVVNLAKIQSI